MQGLPPQAEGSEFKVDIDDVRSGSGEEGEENEDSYIKSSSSEEIGSGSFLSDGRGDNYEEF